MMNAANNNFIAARPMTTTQITKASAFCLFDLMLIGVFSQPGVPPPFVFLAWIVSYIYAFLLAAEVYASVENVRIGLRAGSMSRLYAMVMTFRPMPPMILSATAVGTILSLSVFSFWYGGWIGIIPAGLYLYAGVISAMIYVRRMRYHQSVEWQVRHGIKASSFHSNPENSESVDTQGTVPHRRRMGGHPRLDRRCSPVETQKAPPGGDHLRVPEP